MKDLIIALFIAIFFFSQALVIGSMASGGILVDRDIGNGTYNIPESSQLNFTVGDGGEGLSSISTFGTMLGVMFGGRIPTISGGEKISFIPLILSFFNWLLVFGLVAISVRLIRGVSN